MNKLPLAKRVQVISALMEGAGVNAASRMTDVSKPTILKLVVDLGTACAEYHDKHVRNVKAKRVQCDELWSYCHAKAKNVPEHLKGRFGVGDVWNWIGLESQTKLVISWLVGLRDAGSAYEFMSDIAARVDGRIQLTTDGHAAYLDAVDQSFGIDIDYAMLIKHYGESADQGHERKYSPRPRRVGRLQRGHEGFSSNIAPAVAEAYNFAAFKTVVDVGGGHGVLLNAILQAYVGVNGIVFDSPACRGRSRGGHSQG